MPLAALPELEAVSSTDFDAPIVTPLITRSPAAIAVSADNTPQGLLGQAYWTRPRALRKRRPQERDRLKVQDKETRYWCEVMRQARDALGRRAPMTKPWFQLDRGGDAWPILTEFGDSQEAHDWTWGQPGVCLYCAHCSLVNEILPIERLGFPMLKQPQPA